MADAGSAIFLKGTHGQGRPVLARAELWRSIVWLTSPTASARCACHLDMSASGSIVGNFAARALIWGRRGKHHF